MDLRPVIIIGGNFWGSLLAYRLRQSHPELEFRLYDLPSAKTNSWGFRASEMDDSAMDWLRPMISYSWKQQKVRFEGFSRKFNSTYHVVLPGQFESLVRKSLGPRLIKPIQAPNIEDLLEESSFIIDTRPSPGQKIKYARKTFGCIVELRAPHGIEVPITLDASVRQKGLFRHMQYLPLDTHSLLVSDVRFTNDGNLDLALLEEELLWEVRKKWKIKDVLHRESSVILVPGKRRKNIQDGRILNLSPFMNPLTGEDFPDAIRMIDLMTRTSFRLGELVEVVKRYSDDDQRNRGFARLLRKMLHHSDHHSQRMQLLVYLYNMPGPTVKKFLDSKITSIDILKALWANPPLPLMRAIPSVLPYFKVTSS